LQREGSVNPASESANNPEGRVDRATFAGWVDAYWPRVFRWLLGMTRDQHAAEDLAQETFLKAWRAAGTFRPGAAVGPWLFTIARNTLTDSGRTAPRARPLSQGVPAPSPSPADAVEDREGDALLRAACDGLPPAYREAYLLWAAGDVSFAEVGSIVGTSEATARWRVFKARSLLLAALGSYLDRRPT
jgi:RNA polymerase sigma-70 factor (ECF subfamily)